jgi:predicted CXXCH cytochrome family protein
MDDMEILSLAILILLLGMLVSVRAALMSAAVLCVWWFFWSARPGTEREPVVGQMATAQGMATSNTCRSCHPGAWASWHKSFHRSMTQEPTPSAVLGTFGVTLVEGSSRWILEQEGEDFFATIASDDGPPKRARIALLTGSHHMQNYWMDLDGGWLVQLPWAWWVSRARWIPVRDSFLQPPTAKSTPQVWNDSCVYCHTTQGRRGATHDAAKTTSTVGELGIACEACHGPAQEHTQRSRSPINRYAAWITQTQQQDVLNPAKLEERSDGVCGQCHGVFAHRQGRKRDLSGDVYRPGQDILKSRFFPVFEASVFPSKQPFLRAKVEFALTPRSGASECALVGISPDGIYLACDEVTAGLLVLEVAGVTYRGNVQQKSNQTYLSIEKWSGNQWRHLLDQLGFQGITLTPYDWDAFWRDGTIRTVGREYNGLKASACSTSLRCVSCHTMHGEEPEDQLKSGYRGDAACVECHEAYVLDPSAHTHHGSESTGSRCQNCHMPHTTYGLLGASRSHRIDVPMPVQMQRFGRPNACNLCHLNESVQWSEDHASRWYNRPPQRDRSPSAQIPAGARWVLEGDAAIRAIATWHLGWKPSAETAAVRAWGQPYLREGLLDDYAAIRGIAEQIATTENSQSAFEYTASSTKRQQHLNEATKPWGSARIKASSKSPLVDPMGRPTDVYRSLRERRDQRAVRIAE